MNRDYMDYIKLLDCFRLRDYKFLENKDFNYSTDAEMIVQLGDYCHYKDRLELVYSYLQKHTNQKISEILVDNPHGHRLIHPPSS